MLLIVTRPAAQAADWVRELHALGHTAQALPLIDIAPLVDNAPLHAVWQRLAEADLVMFVSANAVAQFFEAAPRAATWPVGTRAAATGPGTTAALRAAGVPAAAMTAPAPHASRFDSEALWALLEADDWQGRRVLVVRGEDGRDWLADTLRARGAAVEFIAAYRRLPPQLDGAGCALLASALAAPQTHLWLFSSSEAVGYLQTLAPPAAWHDSQAIASHPRIADAARAAGFDRVALAAPSPAAVAAVLAGWPPIQSAPS